MAKSREFLAKGQELLDAHHWPDEAGRAAYLAGFHAAQALIFEKTDKVVKTHKGVQSEFLKLTKDDPGLISSCGHSLAAATISEGHEALPMGL